MTIIQLINGFVVAIVGLAALSLVLNPQAKTSQVVDSLTAGLANDVKQAKSF